MIRRWFELIALYLFHIGFVRPLAHWVIGTRFRRRDLVPSGPCIVVANHNSHLDAGILMSLFPLHRLRYVHPVAAADYFGQNAIRRTAALTLMNGIPISRHPAGGEDPLRPVIEVLQHGESVIFFPEGSRGEAGVVAKFRPGIGKLVKSLPGILVVPVWLSGPERIWPRGQLVPVPINTDARVGRPRSYPASLDARDIAEKVREDVLALAPPPPPVPGKRPGPPLRVAICGIDDDLRERAFGEVTRRLGSVGRTVGLSRKILEADADGVRESPGAVPVTRSRAWPSFLAWLFRTGGLFKGFKFAEMVDRARIGEALEHGRTARFVVGDGNALVDVLAWADADFYLGRFDDRGTQQLLRYLAGHRRIRLAKWWTFVRKAPEVWLLNVFDLVRPPVPGVLALVQVSTEDLMARLRARGGELDRYHNERFLKLLQDAYATAGEALRRSEKTTVLTLDGERRTVEDIAEEIVSQCLARADAAVAEEAPIPASR